MRLAAVESMPIARRMRTLGGLSSALSSSARLEEMRQRGIDIVDFTVGDPDFDTPAHIADAGVKAIRAGHTHYTPARGIAPLRRSIAQSLSASRGVQFAADEIIVAPGAKILVTYALLSLINPGDEVIVPDPGYPAYRSMVEFVGGIPVPMPLLEQRSFAFDPAALAGLVSDKTKMIVINSPNNPTGGLLSAADLRAIAEIAQAGDIWVLSDEVYSEMVYDRPFVSIAAIPGMKARTVLLDSFSKTYAMTGWRLGLRRGAKSRRGCHVLAGGQYPLQRGRIHPTRRSGGIGGSPRAAGGDGQGISRTARPALGGLEQTAWYFMYQTGRGILCLSQRARSLRQARPA